MKSRTHAVAKKRIAARESRDARNCALDFERVVGDILNIHSECIKHAEKAVTLGVTLRNWVIGPYIFEYERRGSDRAQYGARVLYVLSTRLSRDGVDGMAARSLRQYRRFYLTYRELYRQRIGASSGPLATLAMWQTVPAELREVLPAERAELLGEIRQTILGRENPKTPSPTRNSFRKLTFAAGNFRSESTISPDQRYPAKGGTSSHKHTCL